MKAKKILLFSGLLIAALIAFGYSKVKTLQNVFDNMKITPVGLKIKSFNIITGLKFTLDFKLENPTNEAFSISGGSLAKIKQVDIYRQGRFLATANVNLEGIEIPAQSYIKITDIPFTVDAGQLAYNLLTIETFNTDDLSIVATIDVLGHDVQIDG